MAVVEFALRSKAEDDLEVIYLYSLENWGAVQAEEYIQLLDRAFQQLVENPNIGTSCDFVRDGLKMYPVQSHSVFYRIKGNKVVIVRVLHKSMLAGKHI